MISKVATLFDGPLDIVGDIHGEFDALLALLQHLGYSAEGIHLGGRRLVFVGDLTDRGPDSPAVVNLVLAMVERGLAQCLLGNHELNLLRQDPKDGNGWFFEPDHDRVEGRFIDSKHLPAEKQPWLLAHLARLPLALERADLRVVHAAWIPTAIDAVRRSRLTTLELYRSYEAVAEREAMESGLKGRADAEKSRFKTSLKDPNATMQVLESVAALDELEQTRNAVKVLTSGIERATRMPFFANGKWRMTDRMPWWNDYREAVPVIMGHYWRWPTSIARADHASGNPDLFAGYPPHHWFGANRNVYCVDFAVGARHSERAGAGTKTFECRLGAVRWPEGELVFDDGTNHQLEPARVGARHE